MSEQSKILEEMQQLVVEILKSGTATVEQGDRLDELEDLMLEQKCFEKTDNEDHTYLGEEIAEIFFNSNTEQAIEKMKENGITPEDFFGFAAYHFEDEPRVGMFTESFIKDVETNYKSIS
jgi:hypothetical protein